MIGGESVGRERREFHRSLYTERETHEEWEQEEWKPHILKSKNLIIVEYTRVFVLSQEWFSG